MKVESDKVRTWLHDIANRVMPISGVITLMRLGKLTNDDAQLEKLEDKVNHLGETIKQVREELIASIDREKRESDKVYELTYVSRSIARDKPELMQEQIGVIEKQSKRNNVMNAVTGYLLYINGYYFQRLEGAWPSIQTLMSRILLDKRHFGITVISHGEIVQREHRDWQTMHCIEIQEDDEIATHVEQLIASAKEMDSSIASQSLINAVSEEIYSRL